MTTRYQGKSSQPRYLCDGGRACYGHERCQSVAARTVDDEIARLTLLALTPASLEVSLEVAADLERRRAQLEDHWQRRLERARYDVDRARRQYDAVEPENRLVARTLEQAWEEQLRGLQQLDQEYRRFQQNQPGRLTAEESQQIRQLATDLPALWQGEKTSDEDRKQILRQVIERVVVNVEDATEWVELRIHWVGGQQTYSRIRRPVAGTLQLSRWSELKLQLQELKSANLSAQEIADQLHQQGFKPAKGERITEQVVRIWLSRFGLSSSRKAPAIETAGSEWTIPQIVEQYQIPVATLHGWIRRGRVQARQVGGRGGRWIVIATSSELSSADKQSQITRQIGRSKPQ